MSDLSIYVHYRTVRQALIDSGYKEERGMHPVASAALESLEYLYSQVAQLEKQVNELRPHVGGIVRSDEHGSLGHAVGRKATVEVTLAAAVRARREQPESGYEGFVGG